MKKIKRLLSEKKWIEVGEDEWLQNMGYNRAIDELGEKDLNDYIEVDVEKVKGVLKEWKYWMEKHWAFKRMMEVGIVEFSKEGESVEYEILFSSYLFPKLVEMLAQAEIIKVKEERSERNSNKEV